MSSDKAPTPYLDMTLLGKEYRIACPPEEREALISAVTYVDHKMHEIAERTKSNLSERIAVMVALNIAHDFLAAQKKAGLPGAGFDFVALQRRMTDMEAQLDLVIEPPDSGSLS